MTGILQQQGYLNSGHTYQHTQGDMLNNLNKLASELGLSHSEYRLMGVLVGLWNKKKGMAFPTIEYLADICRMGKQTVIKTLDKLVSRNLLVVVKTPGKRNNYYFSNLLLDTSSGIHVKPQRGITCNTAHDITNREQTNRTITSFKNKQHDDVILINNSSQEDNNLIIEKLNNWQVIDAKKLILQHGVEKIKNAIEIVEANKPTNPGAYFRVLINSSGNLIPINKNKAINLSTSLNEGLKHAKEVMQINEPKPTKEEIITKLISEGKSDEAKVLSNLWKIKQSNY